MRSIKEAKGLKVGDYVKNFNAKDIYEDKYNLSNALKNGPLVIIFIRGQWCPFCNKHLKQIQESLYLLYAYGASVVIVSPEKSEFIKKTIQKTGAEFTILYDEDYKIADTFDVTFRPDKMSLFMYNKFLGAKLKESHSDDSERLPIPATFILDIDGKIVWRQLDSNHKNRSKIEDILNNIPKQSNFSLHTV
ncbi:MAG: alkyl hydroperoxide reductase [Bacteroidetes bacterium HGW-Bacteroidetes-2]|nr:MAG: alkyl hydroperoxide reductase [Bacteroidetes bacterium HGW-Bacteroidetes-2]